MIDGPTAADVHRKPPEQWILARKADITLPAQALVGIDAIRFRCAPGSF
jgi:hypothetical protein